MTIIVNVIRPFKNSFFRNINPSAAFDFVLNAMQVLGTIRSAEGLQLDKNEVEFLLPEEDLGPLISGESFVLWLSHPHRCFKFERCAL